MQSNDLNAQEEPSRPRDAAGAALSPRAQAAPSRGRTAPDVEDDDMGRLMAEADQEARSLRRGEMLEGVVVSIDREGVLVDVGMKSEGLIPYAEVQRLVDEQQIRVGETVYVVVIQPEGRSEHTLLSLNRARSERGWLVVQTAFEKGQILTARVMEVNRGGLVGEVEGLRGFVPLSQISSVRSGQLPAGQELDGALGALVGNELAVKVLEVNRGRNRLILSERMASLELRNQRRERLLAELKEGETRHGRVTGLSDFGAFVDLGGTDGLVHLSELAWHPVAKAADVVSVGDEVDVLVLGVDRERQKVSLSLRRTQPEPWATAVDRYPVGALVTGRVARLTTFGAFVRLDDGIEGLIHVSELSDRHVAHPKNVVKEGDVVTVRVLRVEAERRRLGLSLRQANDSDYVDGYESSEISPN